jgi:D-amino-acid dehydrogenase
LLERSSFIPISCPRQIGELARYATNRLASVRYRPGSLPRLLPWLVRYWWHSQAARLEAIAESIRPLLEQSLDEHRALSAAAGVVDDIRPDGWLDLYHSAAGLQAAQVEATRLAQVGIRHAMLDGKAVKQRQPHLLGDFAGAIHWPDSASIGDPHKITAAYGQLATRLGAELINAQAHRLEQGKTGWTVHLTGQPGGLQLQAKSVVVAMGAASNQICASLGWRFPLVAKRGYHMHYDAPVPVELTQPVIDIENGFLLTPTDRGIKLTTGIEFTDMAAPPSYAQLDMAEGLARKILPLGRRRYETPWSGFRPCLPDMRPAIGEARDKKGLWFALGHAHLGLTLGPATGKLLAQMICGEATFMNPLAVDPNRFRH